ncbi:MAG TPA: argininosuccinate synthase [Candidatus Limnocylindria bacterium]|nr:argininosuccinate synthase [Candidatus Limnocylindria bacterium]
MSETVVLAYSGGLDTSVAVPWLRETGGYEVVTLTVDVGGGGEPEPILRRALAGGASQALAVDGRDVFVSDFVWPVLQAGALYQGVYPLATAVARPLIARLLVETAHRVGARHVAHGCTGKGNDQVRFDVAVAALDPALRVIAPMRAGMGMSRDEELAYARARGIDIESGPGTPYSIDVNLWGRSVEAGSLEDPWAAPEADAFAWTVDPERAPREPREIVIGFACGVPVSLDGARLRGPALVERLNGLAGAYGVGRIDHIEDRLVGIKSRELYEAPAAVVLHEAHAALEALTLSRELLAFKRGVADRLATLAYDGLWYSELAGALREFVTSTQRHVTGEVRVRLAPGQAIVVGRRSPESLYDLSLASYGAEDSFDHEAAVGFIKVWGMPVRTQAAARGALAPDTERPLLDELPVESRNGKATSVAATAPVGLGDPRSTGERPVTRGSDPAAGFRPGGTIPTVTRGASYDRAARPDDVEGIWRVVETYARRGILLPRSREEIAGQLDEFRVAELDGDVVGVAALRDFGAGIGELRSLAVLQPAQGRGLGELLVRSTVKQAGRAGIRDLYVLTANPGYFALFGFEEVPWSSVPGVLDADRAPHGIRRRWNTAMVLHP